MSVANRSFSNPEPTSMMSPHTQNQLIPSLPLTSGGPTLMGFMQSMSSLLRNVLIAKIKRVTGNGNYYSSTTTRTRAFKFSSSSH